MGAEEVDDLKHIGPRGVVRRDLDEQELALDGRGRIQLDDLQDVDELVQLLGHLLDRKLGGVHHDGHAGNARVLGLSDGEGMDVEGSARKKGGDSREHARLVLDQNGQRVTGTHVSPPQAAFGSVAGRNERA